MQLQVQTARPCKLPCALWRECLALLIKLWQEGTTRHPQTKKLGGSQPAALHAEATNISKSGDHAH